MEHDIDLLRLSIDPQRFARLVFPKIKYEDIRVRADDAATRGLENYLGEVPDLRRLHNDLLEYLGQEPARPELRDSLLRYYNQELDTSGLHNDILRHRKLFCLRDHVRNNVSDEYYIYKWIVPTQLGLPENQYTDTNTYGPAYVFKLDRYQPRHSPRNGRPMAIYGSMSEFGDVLDRVHNMTDGGGDMRRRVQVDEEVIEGIWKENLLRKMLLLPVVEDDES